MRRSLLDKLPWRLPQPLRGWLEALTRRPIPVPARGVSPRPAPRPRPGRCSPLATRHSLAASRELQGQAAIELAVFGSLLLLCLSLLVRMGLSFNQRQEMTQQAFRNAQARARFQTNGRFYDDDVQYFIVRDLRAPDPTDVNFGMGSRSRQTANAHVLWAHDLFNLEDDEGFPAIFEINHRKFGFPQDDFQYTEKDIPDPKQREEASARDRLGIQTDGTTDETIAGTAARDETVDGITNAVNYNRTEQITTYIRAKQDRPAATALHRGRAIRSTLSTQRNVTWTTPHAQ